MSRDFLSGGSGKSQGAVSMNLDDSWTGRSFLELISQYPPSSRSSLSLSDVNEV